ncbi:MAG TPA: phosphoenolpyruvate kinase [Thermoanaerobaculia bacterium]|nr:phosphoenolpyruvate kinase [Thermoanaerobaculia bacterium]
MNTLSDADIRSATATLEARLVDFMKRLPGSAGERQPVHTVYGGAHLFKSDTPRKLGEVAIRFLQEYGRDARTFANAISVPEKLADFIWQRVNEKLKREPVEDFRIDFEDGYGNRPDDEEDRHAESAAREVARGMRERTLSPFIGIRIKPFTQDLMRRSLRTFDIFLTTLLGESGGKLPSGFVVTLPKIQLPEQVTVLADLYDAIEPRLGLAPRTLRLEFMIETTQSILDEQGQSNLPKFLDAARGRAVAAHFGTYDYTASCNITASEQRMDHPACDFARHNMQVAYAGTGLWLSDGATNIMPIPPHRGDKLTRQQIEENISTVHRAWRLHVDHIRHSLVHAYYQGWDLHPAQLPTRYAAIYAFFLEGLHLATERLRNFMDKAGQATLIGDVFDDAATGQGLLNYFIRGINSGALSEDEALATGLTLDELRSRSFVKILKGRREKAAPPRSAAPHA